MLMRAKRCSYDGLPQKDEADESSRLRPGIRWLKISTAKMRWLLVTLRCQKIKSAQSMALIKVQGQVVGRPFVISTKKQVTEESRTQRKQARPCVMNWGPRRSTCSSMLKRLEV